MDNPNLVEDINRRASTASLNELYSGMAVALPMSERVREAAAASVKVADAIAVGRAFYQNRIRPAIKDMVCGKVQYCKNRGIYDTAASITGLVAEQAGKAIAQLHGLSSEAGASTGKLLVDVSAAVLKEGLNELCSCPEQQR
jgi:hypothetical protein